MSLKAKLVSTVAAFVMVLALMVVGVLAASSATVNLGGSISFTSDHVLATVSVSVSGSEQDATVNGTGDYTHSFTSSTTAPDNTWAKDDIDLSFADQDTDIVITITVVNDSTERALTLTASTLPSATGTNISLNGQVQYNLNSAGNKELTTAPITVAATQSVVITMTIQLDNPALSVTNGAWTAAFALANVAKA